MTILEDTEEGDRIRKRLKNIDDIMKGQYKRTKEHEQLEATVSNRTG